MLNVFHFKCIHFFETRFIPFGVTGSSQLLLGEGGLHLSHQSIAHAAHSLNQISFSRSLLMRNYLNRDLIIFTDCVGSYYNSYYQRSYLSALSRFQSTPQQFIKMSLSCEIKEVILVLRALPLTYFSSFLFLIETFLSLSGCHQRYYPLVCCRPHLCKLKGVFQNAFEPLR